MARRAGQWLLAVALALSLGAHWFTLQMVAWTGMLVSFSRTDSVATALMKTFDGKHACPLCLAVDEGRRSERSQETSAPVRKLEFANLGWPSAGPNLLPPAPYVFPPPRASAPERFQAPPVPPPRFA